LDLVEKVGGDVVDIMAIIDICDAGMGKDFALKNGRPCELKLCLRS
jgi:hypothetical protein